jgi:hypothetical protein
LLFDGEAVQEGNTEAAKTRPNEIPRIRERMTRSPSHRGDGSLRSFGLHRTQGREIA